MEGPDGRGRRPHMNTSLHLINRLINFALLLKMAEKEKIDKKEHLLNVAERVFGEMGYDGASTRVLAQEAGVNMAMLNYYFGSKDGLLKAVVERRMSLLPAGVIGVDGDFAAGDPVDLLTENGHVVARGLVNFDAAEMPGLLGRSTRELARELGPAYEREVVHRDDLVLLRSRGQ